MDYQFLKDRLEIFKKSSDEKVPVNRTLLLELLDELLNVRRKSAAAHQRRLRKKRLSSGAI